MIVFRFYKEHEPADSLDSYRAEEFTESDFYSKE
jgi:hypothetical protein